MKHALPPPLWHRCLALLFALGTWQTQQAQTITLPAANTNGTATGQTYTNNPFGSYWGFERTQLLYTAAEHGLDNRRITALGFYVNSLSGPAASTPTRIYIRANSTNTIVSAGTYASAISGATQVWNGNITSGMLSANNWVTITLSTPFDYLGNTNSIEVMVETNATGAGNEGSENSKVFRWSNPGANRAQTWRQDNSAPTGNGTVESLRANIQITHQAISPPCSGTPVVGTAAALPTSLSCPGLASGLSVSGFSTDLNIAFQWQQRFPSGTGVWTNISGATGQTQNVNPFGTTDYRCNVTCTNSGLSAPSAPVTVTVAGSPVSLPYTESFETLVTSMNQAFPLGCILHEFVSGNASHAWLGSNGTSGTGLTARTGTKCVYARWSLVAFMHFPAVSMTAGSTYRFSFWYKHAQSSSNPSLNFDVRVGTAPLASAQTTVLQTLTNQNNTTYSQVVVDYVCPSSGTYHFSIRNNATTSNPWELVVDDVQITDLNNCSGTPAPGNTLSSLASVCASQGFDLSTSNLLTQTGLTFQWERSTTGGAPWTPISGATGNSLAGQTQSTATWYRLTATCTTSGLSASSTPVQVNQNALADCYCTPPSTNCTLNDKITQVNLGTLSNSSLCGSNGFTKYTNTPPDLIVGSSQTLGVTVGAGAASGVVGVWFDWNQSGTYETSEYYLVGVSPANGGSLSLPLTVPMGATLGQTRFRVRLKGEKTNPGDLSSSEACTNLGIYVYGETEDYLIQIQPQPNCSGTPSAGTPVPASVGVCAGGNIGTLTTTGFTSGFSGLSFQWESSTDNLSWNPVPGGNLVSLSPGLYGGGSLYYRLTQTCSFSGLTGNSASIPVGINAPTVQASALLFPSVSNTQFTVSFTAGNGARRLVFVHTSASFTDPTGAPSSANSVWQNAGQQLVYDGTGNSVTITGLTDGSTYHVRVYEYNECPVGAPTSWLYQTATAFANPASVDLPAVFAYDFSEAAGTWTPITGGTVLGAGQNLDEHVFGSNTATAGPLASTTGLPIGFSFPYQGLNYDRFGVGINGFLKLGTGTFGIPNQYQDATNVINTAAAESNNLIAGFHADLYTESAVGSELRYQTIGSPGSRTLVVQFKDFRMFPGLPTDRITFQIRLEEATGQIRVVYQAIGTSVNLPIAKAVVGIKGIGLAATADNVFLRTSRVSTQTLSEGNMGKSAGTSLATMSQGVWISSSVSPYRVPANFSGLTYTWTPLTCKIPAPVAVLPSPLGSTTATLQWGSVAGAVSYDVRWRVAHQEGSSVDTTTVASWSIPTNSGSNSLAVTGLFPNSVYWMEVRARCGAQASPFSQTFSFQTQPAAQDAGLVQLSVNPDPESNSSCNPIKSVVAQVRNWGTAPILAGTVIPVDVQVSGAISQTLNGSLTLPGNLAPGTTFSGSLGTVNMGVVGSYTLSGATSWPGDENPFNNALASPITRTYTQIVPAGTTYVQGFNAGFLWRTEALSGPNTWAHQANNLSFPSLSPFEGNGMAFFNAFVFPAGSVAGLFSPCIVLPDTCYVLRFRHSRDNAVPGALTEGTVVKVSTDGVTFSTLPLKNLSTGRDTTFARRYYGPASSPVWHEFEADLSAYSNQTITLLFEATGNAGYNFALDNVALSPVSANDVGLTSVVSPEPFATCGSKTTQVVVRVRNFGCSPQSNIPVTVTVTGAVSPNPTVLNGILAGPLAPGSSQDLNLGTINTPSVGSITLTGGTLLAGDEDNGNNGFGTVQLQLKSAPLVNLSLSNANLVAGFGATIGGNVSIQSPDAYFANNTNTTLSDNVVGIFASNSQIAVSGLPAGTQASTIKSVTLNLLHPFVSELRLRLQAPDGSEIILKNEYTDNTPNANLIGTVFTPLATQPIASGSAPFNGSFLPEEPFANLTGQANGNWRLYIADYYIQNAGVLLNWAISFQNGLNQAAWTCPTCPTGFPVNFTPPIGSVAYPSNPVGASFPAGSYTVRLSATDYQGCVAGNDTTLNFFTSNTWLGISDVPAGNNWTNPANWNAAPSPPTSTVAVTIPAGTPFPPRISGTASVGSVFMLPGADLQLTQPTAQLQVGANWSGSGNVLSGDGEIVFNGGGTQTISGLTRFRNVRIAKSTGGLNIGGVARLSGLLTLANASSGFSVAPTGSLILHSDATETGRIGPIPAGALITGNVVQERFLPHSPGSTGSWFFMGSPFAGRNFTEWSDDFKVVGLSTGFGSQGSGIYASPEPERSTVFQYQENLHGVKVDTVQKRGWRIPGNQNIQPGRGYRVYVDRYSNTSGKVDHTGSITSGLFNFPTLTRTVVSPCFPTTPGFDPTVCHTGDEGFNLLANPYPCALDWDAAGGWSKPGSMNNAFYTWNAAARAYRVYLATQPGVGLGSVTASAAVPPQLIPSSQAFFVHLLSGSSATLSVNESAKSTAQSGTFVRQTTELASSWRFLLEDPQDSDLQFRALLRLAEQTSQAFDPHWDALGLASGFGLNWTTPGGQHLVAQTLAPSPETQIVPLLLQGLQAGKTYRLRLENPDSGEDQDLFLKDNWTGLLQDLHAQPLVEFSFLDQPGEAEGRFEIVLNPSSATGLANALSLFNLNLFPNPVSGGGQLFLQLPEGRSVASLWVQDAAGRRVVDIANPDPGSRVSMALPLLPAGVYILRGHMEDGTPFSRKFSIRP